MNRRVLTIVMLAALAALAACSSAGNFMDGPEGLPGVVNGVTDVGNPNDEVEAPKGIYVNREFEVQITYPGSMSVEERSSSEANFSSDKGESVTTTFVRLSQGQGLEDFLTESRGRVDDLNEGVARTFDRVLCNPALAAVDEDGMRGVECYFYADVPEGAFVMAMTGIYLQGEGFSADVQRSQSRDEDSSSLPAKTRDYGSTPPMPVNLGNSPAAAPPPPPLQIAQPGPHLSAFQRIR